MELAAAAAKSVSAWDEPGTLGFLMVFGMAVILFFVFRSLAKHLRKINEAARLEAAQAEPGLAGTVQASPAPGSESPVGPPPVNGARPTF
jgi:hypothetical protein